jgi:hypothetical protein
VGGFFMFYELIEVTVEEFSNTQPFDSVMPRPPTDHPEQRVISGFWQRLLAFIVDGLLLSFGLQSRRGGQLIGNRLLSDTKKAIFLCQVSYG